MKAFIVYTQEKVIGKTMVMADNEYTARDMVLEDIQIDQFTPDLSVSVKADIKNVIPAE